jgi:hypothetical protein
LRGTAFIRIPRARSGSSSQARRRHLVDRRRQIRQETPGAGERFLLGVDGMIDAPARVWISAPPSSCLVEILAERVSPPADRRRTSPKLLVITE